MGIYSDIMKRTDAGNLASYFLYGGGRVEEGESAEQRTGKAYEQLFEQLKTIFPAADPDNEELMDMFINFAKTFEEVYFEAGLAAGFELYKNMDKRIAQLKKQ